jgi:predicted Zn finger-like uncharacterized protein
MKFVCDRCQTKYSIPDERVRGKVLKVKCKTCANLIVVREARRPSVAGAPSLSTGAAGAAARPRSGVHPPIDTTGENEERTQLAQAPIFPDADPFPDIDAFAPHPPAARRPTGPLAPAAAADDHVQWYMALDGNRTGPFPRQKLVDRLLPLARNADVHIWNERLGTWKPPGDVPEIASEITRRRAPPPPPPLPGTPRRPTPPPIPPLSSGPPHGQPARKPTGPHAPPSPVGHGPAGGASKLPPPGGVHPALAARGAHEATGGDPSSLLETPAPMPHQLPHAPKTNGVGKGHAPPRPVNSDVMQMLNMPGASQTVPGAPPKLISVASTIAMGGGTVAPQARSRSAIYILGLLAIVGIVVVLVATSVKKPKPVAVVAPPPVAPAVVEKQAEPPPPPPVQEPVVEPTQPPPPPHGKGQKGRPLKPARGAVKGQPATPGTTPLPANPGSADAQRFGDKSHGNLAITPGGGNTSRPPPAQGDIMKVIANNRSQIKVCYQRALTRDNSLTHGKLAVNLSIGISGKVKKVGLDGPAQFRTLLEPCIKEVVSRWVFPPASEEYGTEFPLVFQGNE